MNTRYKEWEIVAQRDGDKDEWVVSDPELPALSYRSAVRLCTEWHEKNPDITYTPKGFIITRTAIENEY